MNVRELNDKQLYELKDKVFYINENDLQEETGLWSSLMEVWDDNIQIEWEKAQFPCDISDETIYKLFDGINFVNDDFCCSCGLDVQLTYTEEMKKQDALWKIEKEDFEVMEKLFYNIMEEAKQKGFKGCYKIYKTDTECVCEVYSNEEEMQKYCNGEIDAEFMFGYCEVLIEHLEQCYLN